MSRSILAKVDEDKYCEARLYLVRQIMELCVFQLVVDEKFIIPFVNLASTEETKKFFGKLVKTEIGEVIYSQLVGETCSSSVTCISFSDVTVNNMNMHASRYTEKYRRPCNTFRGIRQHRKKRSLTCTKATT